jgi:hypothetical protein
MKIAKITKIAKIAKIIKIIINHLLFSSVLFHLKIKIFMIIHHLRSKREEYHS